MCPKCNYTFPFHITSKRLYNEKTQCMKHRRWLRQTNKSIKQSKYVEVYYTKKDLYIYKSLFILFLYSYTLKKKKKSAEKVHSVITGRWQVWMPQLCHAWHAVCPVKHSNTSQSWVSVSLFMQKRLDSTFLSMLQHKQQFEKDRIGWLHVSAFTFPDWESDGDKITKKLCF